MEGYSNDVPFDSSMMVHFRKRISLTMLTDINEQIQQEQSKKKARVDNSSEQIASEKPTHKGKLLIDATCVPADIRYPTDLSLLNEAREKTEEVIDKLHKKLKGARKKSEHIG